MLVGRLKGGIAQSRTTVAKLQVRTNLQGGTSCLALFANPQAYDMVEEYRVDHEAGFSVHDVLQLHIRSKGTTKHPYHKENGLPPGHSA